MKGSASCPVCMTLWPYDPLDPPFLVELLWLIRRVVHFYLMWVQYLTMQNTKLRFLNIKYRNYLPLKPSIQIQNLNLNWTDMNLWTKLNFEFELNWTNELNWILNLNCHELLNWTEFWIWTEMNFWTELRFELELNWILNLNWNELFFFLETISRFQ